MIGKPIPKWNQLVQQLVKRISKGRGCGGGVGGGGVVGWGGQASEELLNGGETTPRNKEQGIHKLCA